MAIPPRPPVRDLPPGPDVADEALFNEQSNVFFPEVTPWGAEVNTLADWMRDRADEIAVAAPQALSARDEAQSAADAAEGHKDTAEAAAAAAQSAAGLPALAGRALMPLRVNAAGDGVEFAPSFALPVAGTGATVDTSAGNYFTVTVDGDTTFAFTGTPPGAYGFTLEVNHASGIITWPASVEWPLGLAPPLSAGAVHMIGFVTSDGGTTWRGAALFGYEG